MKYAEWFFIALIAAIGVVSCYSWVEASSDCRKAGGVPVRGAAVQIECVRGK